MAARKRPIRKPFPVTKDDEDLDSLFVFGYECKLFRDDEKAAYVDQGRHLIPWMGDSSLLIDRYDGRGHLYDLNQYDAANVKTEGGLSEEDLRIEALCDEERYMELNTDVAEKVMYEEEELKRLNQAFNEAYDEGGYAAVGFNYTYGDGEEEDEDEGAGEATYDEDDEPYEVPPDLQLPPDIVPPATEKFATIIEKTAKFVATQGAQMEILIKTKQTDNPQFAFLEFGEPLNDFYKHMKTMIKSGRYKPKADKAEVEKEPEGQEYLHPKLMKLMQRELEPELNSKDFLESVKSKLPSGQLNNSLYAKLVTNMKQASNGRNSPTSATARLPPKKLLAEPAASVSPYNMSSPVSRPPPQLVDYGLPHSIPQAQPAAVYGPSEVTLPPPPGMEPVTLPSAVPAQPQPPPPGTVPHSTMPHVPMQQPQPVQAPMVQPQLPETSGGHIDILNGAYNMADMSYEEEEDKNFTVPPPLPLLSDQQFLNSDRTPLVIMYPPRRQRPFFFVPPGIMVPPPDQAPIVDKMAAYVAKNGPDFEAVVRNKIDERFHFLNSWHIHNKYYEYRKNIYLNEFAASNVKVTITQTSQNAAGDTVVTKTTTTLANASSQPSKGVSFSIKAKDNEGTALTGRKIMLYDSSSDEEDEDVDKKKKETESDSSDLRVDGTKLQDPSKTDRSQLNTEEIEKRNAEERSKDRISMVVREKVAAAGREKQLQLERKRRAAMFINMLKGSDEPAESGSGPESEAIPKSIPVSSSAPNLTTLGKDEPTKDATSAAPPLPSNSPKNSPHRSRSPSPQKPRSSSRAGSKAKSPSRTRSPGRSERHRVRDVERRKHRSPRRSRSRSPQPWRRRSPSPRNRRRFRSRTPPAMPTAYAVVRRSRSKSASRKRSRTKSKSPTKHKKKRGSRSRSRDRGQMSHARISPFRSKDKKSLKRSKSKSPSRKHKSHSPSRAARKEKSRSKSPSKKSKKSHKHKSRSPTSTKKSSRHGKSKEGSKSKLMPIPEVKTPLSLAMSNLNARSKASMIDDSRDDDIIIISPVKEDPASPPLPPPPPPPAPVFTDPPLPPLPELPSMSAAPAPPAAPTAPLPPVDKDILSKVRAMLRASRAQILKEDGPMNLD